jgi:hypothetical protein
MRRMNFSTTSRLGWVVVLGLLLLVAGCRRQASISGKVTYNGKPMPGGSITFIPVEGGGGGTARIDPKDGSYELPNLPVGKMKIGVTANREPAMPGGKRGYGPPKDSGAPSEAMKGASDSTGGQSVVISPEFTDPQGSPLEFEVKPGKNTHDVEVSGPAKKTP